MQEIKVDSALWATSMLPEGVVERWLVVDGATVAAGDKVVGEPNAAYEADAATLPSTGGVFEGGPPAMLKTTSTP